MSWKKEGFGTAPSGQEVYKYTLMNAGGASAAFTDLGGIWLEMKVPDRDGAIDDVILGWGSAAECLTNSGHLGEIVGRNANRIGGAACTLNGKEYTLTKNDGANNLHSGLDFYRKRIWGTSVAEEDGAVSITFTLESPDGDQGYPGNAQIAVTYTLTDENALRIDYSMTCDADTIANFTNHAYFNLAGQAAGTIAEQLVWIDADSYTVASADSIPTGEIAPVAGTPMDFTVKKAIGKEIDADFQTLKDAGGYDHNWVLRHAPGELALSVVAEDPGTGRVMEVYTDLPGVQFYTANGFKPALSKDGVTVYQSRGGYCFETQYFPDAVNKPNFSGPVLKKGEEYQTTTVYQFRVS